MSIANITTPRPTPRRHGSLITGGRKSKRNNRSRYFRKSRIGKRMQRKMRRSMRRRRRMGGGLDSSSYMETPGVPTTSSNGVHFLANNPQFAPFP